MELLETLEIGSVIRHDRYVDQITDAFTLAEYARGHYDQCGRAGFPLDR